MPNPNEAPSTRGPTSTAWTQIIEVMQKDDSAAALAALNEFCERYRPAVYNFFLQHGSEVERAKDLTQEFFANRILKRWENRSGFVFTANRSKGKFRSFLSHVLWQFLKDEWTSQNTAKAGGGVPHSTLDGLELTDESGGEAAFKKFGSEFDRVFAVEIIQRAAERSPHSKYLVAHLKGEISQRDAGTELGLSEEAFKAAYNRFKDRVALNLRDEVSKLVGPDEREIRAEIEYLIRLFGEGPA
jgi:DNA-directed RNA polymerase specialized sigma24 family protein